MNEEHLDNDICLKVVELCVSSHKKYKDTPLLNNVSIEVISGKSTALLGSSGCGKTLTALSILDLLPKNLTCRFGEYVFENKELTPSGEDILKLRGKKIAMIFQDAVGALNPVITVGRQLNDVVTTHLHSTSKETKNIIFEHFHQVGFRDPIKIYQAYPHQLSGGMAQRVMIAMALCCQSSLIIADEPTTALDTITQKQVLDLLKKLQKKNKFSLLLISHDINVVSTLAEHIYIMKDGSILEHGTYDYLSSRSTNTYTLSLFQ